MQVASDAKVGTGSTIGESASVEGSMTEAGEPPNAAISVTDPLDRRLKQLEIENKEYEQQHRPSPQFSILTNPAVVAAIIAGGLR